MSTISNGARKIIGIYHKGCTDGTTSGAVLLKRFPHAKVFPLSHDYDKKAFKHIISLINKNTTVYTTDCVIGIKEFLKKAKRVVGIDHHANMQTEMERLSKHNERFTYIFRNDRSGASLAWEYFFPKKKLPRIIQLVQDFDIWQWKYGDTTKHAVAYLYTLQDEPEKIKKYFSGNIKKLLQTGKIYTDYDEYNIAEYIKKYKPITLKIGVYKIPAFNCHMYEDQLGNRLSKKYGKAVGIFRIRGEKINISFRSHDNQNPSAQKLAEICGGGGHRNASAARIPLKKFLGMVIT